MELAAHLSCHDWTIGLFSTRLNCGFLPNYTLLDSQLFLLDWFFLLQEWSKNPFCNVINRMDLKMMVMTIMVMTMMVMTKMMTMMMMFGTWRVQLDRLVPEERANCELVPLVQ